MRVDRRCDRTDRGRTLPGLEQDRAVKWSTSPEVVVADRGKEFTFRTPQTIWSYTFAEVDGGTVVTEGFEVTAPLTKFFSTLTRREAGLRKGIEQTLARIKAAVEK